MSSDDLLNQPIPDDPDLPGETAAALSNFFGNAAPKGTDGIDLPSEVVRPDDPGPSEQEDKAETEGAASSIDDQIDQARAQLEELEATPAERYKKLLKEEGISEVEARRIIDKIVVELKPYAETFELNDKVSVTFRTRTQADQQRINEVLETMQPQYRMTIQSEVSKHNLACSLMRYGDTKFTRDDEGVAKAIKWLTSIPTPVFVLLQNKLYQFDRKIDAVFQEGYIENFYRTPS